MKYSQIENLSNQELAQKLKEVKAVSLTMSTKFASDEKFNRALKIQETLKKEGFVEQEGKVEIGQFGITKFFTKE